MKLGEIEQKLREKLPEAVFRQAEAVSGIAWSVEVPATRIRECARIFDASGFFLESLTGLDFEDTREIVYHFGFYAPNSRVAVRVLSKEGMPVPTLCDIFQGAAWLEREVHEFFGINFDGNPDLRALLLPEDADYRPLRKTFGSVGAYRKRDEIYG